METTYEKIVRQFLFWVLLFIGLCAVFGGFELLSNSLSMPREWLASSPFGSYLWPGLILAFVVGGTHLAAAMLLLKEHSLKLEAAAIAAFGLLIWIFTQMYIIKQNSWLQIVYFSLALLTLTLTISLYETRAKDHQIKITALL